MKLKWVWYVEWARPSRRGDRWSRRLGKWRPPCQAAPPQPGGKEGEQYFFVRKYNEYSELLEKQECPLEMKNQPGKGRPYLKHEQVSPPSRSAGTLATCSAFLGFVNLLAVKLLSLFCTQKVTPPPKKKGQTAICVKCNAFNIGLWTIGNRVPSPKCWKIEWEGGGV